MRILVTTIMIFSSLALCGQTSYDTKSLKEQYPDENFYFLSDKSSVNISFVENKLEIKSTISNEVLFLTEKAPQFSRRSVFYYDETEEISNVTGTSIIPLDKGKQKKVPVEKTFSHKPIKDGVFYDDFKEIYFDFPGLKEGAVASMSYNVKTKDPHFLDPFYFANNSPSRDMEYSISFPKEVSLKYFLKGDTSNIRFSKKENKNITTYTWTAHNQPAYDQEREEGNYRRYAPHVIVYVEWYKLNNQQIAVLGDVSQLYSWYSTHINDLTNNPEKEVKALADSLTAGLTTDSEKIAAIYYWVQENIKYIAFEYGLGGFVPRKADLVRSRRYGDCKDNSSLLYSLYRSIGIPAYFTWIGTREIPYSYSELPTPAVNNHMIVSVYNNKKWIFLDGISSYLPFGYPSGFIQEKEALIGISKDSFLISKVPIVAMERNYKIDSINLMIKDDDLVGTGFTGFGGLWRNSICNAFYNVPQKDKQDQLKKLLITGNNKCIIDSINYFGLSGYVDSLSLIYNISIPDYCKKIDNRLFVNLNLKKTLQDDKVLIDKRKTEERYKYQYVSKEVTILDIPENYKMLKIPENSFHTGKYYGYELTYHSSAGKIWMEKKIYFNQLQKNTGEFEDWNKMVEKITEAYSQVAVLEKK